MKKILAILSLFLTCTLTQALGIDPFKGAKPIAVLIQTDPWLMVIGSDTPMVAIYDDGQVLYLKKGENENPSLLQTQLSPDALTKIKDKLSSFGDYSKLKRHYNLMPKATDLPETKIYLSLHGKEFVTDVYGLMVSNTQLPAYSILGNKQNPDGLPQEIRELHTYLTSLNFTEAKPWRPTYIEVVVWPYDYAPNESIHWLKEWPGLDSPNTLNRGNSYSIFLPGKELSKLQDFLKTRKEKGAVEIGGKKWAASLRYTFPGEPIWFKAFKSE